MTTLVSIPLDDARIGVRGALGARRDKGGLLPSRLPDWAQARSPSPAFALMAGMTSGVRLDFATTSTVWEVDLLETGLRFDGEPRRPVIVDVVSNGVLMSRALGQGHTIVVGEETTRFDPGVPQTLRFDLGPGEKRVQAWLPQAAITEVLGFRLDSGADFLAPPQGARRWAHYGSSLSHGMEAAGPARTWPALVARRAGLDLLNLGLAGECHLDGFMARVLGEASADLISLELGINVVSIDTLRQRTFPSAVHTFLDVLRGAAPNAPVLVISPFHCPPLEDAPGPLRRVAGDYQRQARPHARADGALTAVDVRRILQEVVAQRRAEGDTALAIIDGSTLFSAEDAGDLADAVHPNARGHETMAERFFDAAFQNGLFSGRDGDS
ncbi:GDSL-type esterase/lipase family protein [Caulobacter sp. CCH9-E1]|uniref:GDSL-type esterase/lipase family protein n=1 Tax=Caulobacter sp. CCH9-E1 TaxID=1768768 RepID=UPI0008328B56|nr:GDSL-type esterase/lipase family protein [Caulobacter sp. CCH9-E1]